MNDVDDEPTQAIDPVDEWTTTVRKGALATALLVLAVAVLYAFFSIGAAIETWLRPRWVPVARAVFGVAVAGLAIYIIIRLTR